jgi:hypothetical protein
LAAVTPDKSARNPSIARLIRKEEKETVIREGELLKCSCGLGRGKKEPNYMPRWCQITHYKFRYYKNRIAAF